MVMRKMHSNIIQLEVGEIIIHLTSNYNTQTCNYNIKYFKHIDYYIGLRVHVNKERV